MDLQDRTVVVVGGARGIGRAVAQRAHAAGARVVLAARDPARLEEAAATMGEGVCMHVADATREEDVVALMEAVGSFDHLVSTTNRRAGGRVTELQVADVQEAMAAKLLAPLLLAKHAASRVARDGSLTFFSGYLAWRPAAGSTVQSLVNGGLAAFTSALAVELGPVRVNAIAPGTIDSDAWASMEPAQRQAMLEGFAQRAPVGAVGQLEDVVDATMMVMTNRFVSGSVVHVDGGARFT
jgi:NAD(P)-dependent dehydrogenase (short-subunit alcohol dehydrogenase family)